jgi:hypothetical protein
MHPFLLTDSATDAWGWSRAADSILGVSLFADESPVDFGRFDQAFITMFRITAGETVSLTSLPIINPATGVVDYRVAIFTITYVSVVIWVLLQVRPTRSGPLRLLLGAAASTPAPPCSAVSIKQRSAMHGALGH